MSIVNCKNVSFAYDSEKTVLNNVTFSIEKGQLISLIGPNGVGKSTLLNCIAGLIKPDSGVIELNEKCISTMSAKTIAQNIAYVPQKNATSFDYSVKDFVVMGRTAQMSVLSVPSRNDYIKAQEALERLGVEHLSERSITKLSGGEQQKVCIARALVQEPKLIIMDEPTSALDYGNQMKVLKLIRELASLDYAVLFTTHNPDHSLILKSDVAILKNGGFLEFGKYSDILTQEKLSEVYNTELRLEYIAGIERMACIPKGLCRK